MVPPLVQLALDYYRDPLAYSHLADVSRPLPAGFPELLNELGAALSGAHIADTATALSTEPAELHEAARFFARHALLDAGGDYYRYLGLTRDASTESVRTHYQLLIRMFHPDRVAHASDADLAYSSRLNAAYRVLRDPDARARYDAELPPYPARSRRGSLNAFFQPHSPALEAPQLHRRWGLGRVMRHPVVVLGAAGGLLVGAALLVLQGQQRPGPRLQAPVDARPPPAVPNYLQARTAAQGDAGGLPQAGSAPDEAAAAGPALDLGKDHEPIPGARDAAVPAATPGLAQTGAPEATVAAVPAAAEDSAAAVQARLTAALEAGATAAEARLERQRREAAAEQERQAEARRRRAVAEQTRAAAAAAARAEANARAAREAERAAAAARAAAEERAASPGPVARAAPAEPAAPHARAAPAAPAARAAPAAPAGPAAAAAPLPAVPRPAAEPAPGMVGFKVVQRLEQAYQRGDVDALAGLFTADANTSDGRGRALIRAQYARAFAGFQAQRLSVDGMRWQSAGDGRVRGVGRVSVSAQDRAGGAWQRSSGSLELELVQTGADYRIATMRYQLE